MCVMLSLITAQVSSGSYAERGTPAPCSSTVLILTTEDCCFVCSILNVFFSWYRVTNNAASSSFEEPLPLFFLVASLVMGTKHKCVAKENGECRCRWHVDIGDNPTTIPIGRGKLFTSPIHSSNENKQDADKYINIFKTPSQFMIGSSTLARFSRLFPIQQMLCENYSISSIIHLS